LQQALSTTSFDNDEGSIFFQLGYAYYDRVNGDKVINLTKSIGFFHKAVSLLKTPSTGLADAYDRFGNAYEALAKLGVDPASNAAEAIKCYQQAISYTLQNRNVGQQSVPNWKRSSHFVLNDFFRFFFSKNNGSNFWRSIRQANKKNKQDYKTLCIEFDMCIFLFVVAQSAHIQYFDNILRLIQKHKSKANELVYCGQVRETHGCMSLPSFSTFLWYSSRTAAILANCSRLFTKKKRKEAHKKTDFNKWEEK
jgi:tetratricopeptide (TPR) repeat protein